MLYVLLLFCNVTSLCLLLISSTQSTSVILSPEGRNYLCKMKKTLPYVWFQSEQCAGNTFLRKTMHTLFKLYLLCSWLCFIWRKIEAPLALGGIFPPVVAHWYMATCASVCGLWLPWCLIADGLHLLFGPFCSRSASFCVTAPPGDLDFWLTACDELDKTT